MARASSMPTSMSRTTRWRAFTCLLLLGMMEPRESCGDLHLGRALGEGTARPSPARGAPVDDHQDDDGREVGQHVHELRRDALPLEAHGDRVGTPEQDARAEDAERVGPPE